ncbi:hypothetical protein [Treponema sp.]|uniref:hypothetical protein n=1 Tax=Treponema sp. TaxID=166 RepID=UPI003FD740F7
MEENESNVIEHLLEVENIASSFTVDAQNKASEILNSAKAKTEQDYLSKFNIQSAELEKSFKEESAKINEKIVSEINSYKENIYQSVQDKTAFSNLMNNLVLQK